MSGGNPRHIAFEAWGAECELCLGATDSALGNCIGKPPEGATCCRLLLLLKWASPPQGHGKEVRPDGPSAHATLAIDMVSNVLSNLVHLDGQFLTEQELKLKQILVGEDLPGKIREAISTARNIKGCALPRQHTLCCFPVDCSVLSDHTKASLPVPAYGVFG
jgi:hypothetical protein